jgi:hypothetical protein
MTVGADDFTQLDLLLDPPNGPAVRDENADVRFLRTKVVELEHPQIGLSAIRAWVSPKVVVNERPRDRSPLATGRRGLLPVNVTPGPEIRPEAFLAPPLTAFLRMPTE